MGHYDERLTISLTRVNKNEVEKVGIRTSLMVVEIFRQEQGRGTFGESVCVRVCDEERREEGDVEESRGESSVELWWNEVSPMKRRRGARKRTNSAFPHF
jgi:hypothetical protein